MTVVKILFVTFLGEAKNKLGGGRDAVPVILWYFVIFVNIA